MSVATIGSSKPTAFEHFLRDSLKIRQWGRGMRGYHPLSREPVDRLDPVPARSHSGRDIYRRA